MACSASSDFRTSRRRCISSSCCCICCCFSTWNSRICANRGLNFVSVSQWEPWGSPHAGWKGKGSNRFPTPAHAVIHKSTVLFAILAGTPEQPFSYTCTCCHTYKCSVIWYLPFWQVHFDQLFPTPAHAVIHTSAVIRHSSRYAWATISPHLCMLSYTNAVLTTIPAGTLWPTLPHTYTCCHTYVICHSGRYTLTNSSPHMRMLSYIQVLFAIPAGTLWPTLQHTCACCHTSKCSVTWHSSRYTWSTLSPHLYMLLYIQVQCYLTLQQVHLINSFPTPVHADVHTSVLLPANPTAVLQLQGFS